MSEDRDSRRATGRLGVVAVAAVLAILAAAAFAAPSSRAAAASPASDAEAVSLAAKHCVACHAAEPTHPAFGKAPKGIRLETLDELRRHAKDIITQVVVERAMPLGNETDMTDEERDRLGAWAEGHKE
jgi:uncharacterized membrane protein